MRISDCSSDVCSSDLDFRQDVLSQHSPPRANSPGKPDSIIALTRTDISDGHTRSDPCAIHDVVGFVQPVAAFLVRPARGFDMGYRPVRSEEHTSELQSLMRISYAVFCLKQNKNTQRQHKI